MSIITHHHGTQTVRIPPRSPLQRLEDRVRAHELERLEALEEAHGLRALFAWRADFERRHGRETGA